MHRRLIFSIVRKALPYAHTFGFLCLFAGCGGIRESQEVSLDLGRMGLPNQVVTFTEVRRSSFLPRSILDQFQGGIADPGDDFQATDVRVRPLPLRRLVVAGTSEKYVIVQYERGGIGQSSLLALFHLSDGKANVLWVSHIGRVTDLKQLKETLETHQFANELGRTTW
jgi:hypothetical protein